jgi:GT2 family glycosyltransferase
MSPAFTIIIPNFNGQPHLEACLGSLRRQSWVDFEILLVDNGSTDGSPDYVRSRFPEVQVVELDRNRGFTGAGNAGWRLALGEHIVLLNNDTEAHSGWLAAIADAFARHPEVGAIASKMLLFDRRDHFHTAGDFYRLDGLPGNRGVWQKDSGQFDREEYVFSACGGSAAYRRAMIEEIGFLDDDFFFSCEDVDLSWRAQLAGWRVLYVPSAIVYHKLKATGGGPISSYYDGRNFLYVIWKNYPGPLLRRHWPLIARAQWRLAREAARAWRSTPGRARLKGQLAGLAGVLKMLPKRRLIQAGRRITDDYLMALLTPVDETPGRR